MKTPVAFKTEAALKFFRSQWRKQYGTEFRAVRKCGENHGYELREPWEIEFAKSVEATRPGTFIGLHQ